MFDIKITRRIRMRIFGTLPSSKDWKLFIGIEKNGYGEGVIVFYPFPGISFFFFKLSNRDLTHEFCRKREKKLQTRCLACRNPYMYEASTSCKCGKWDEECEEAKKQYNAIWELQ